jgi:uncharacterized protein (TIGR02453 family)
MKYFDKDFNSFFNELTENNNRDWFILNKKRYENSVKNPFFRLVDDLIVIINKEIEPTTAKESIFRINRDVRFSKEKQPYKTNVSALITPKGRKDKENPGLYIELNSNSLNIYGGCYMPNKENLDKIRWHILDNSKRFNGMVSDIEFTKFFKEIKGEKNKILPKEFKAASIDLPILYNKQFYYTNILPKEIIQSEKLVDIILNHYKAGLKLQSFFIEAINL